MGDEKVLEKLDLIFQGGDFVDEQGVESGEHL